MIRFWACVDSRWHWLGFVLDFQFCRSYEILPRCLCGSLGYKDCCANKNELTYLLTYFLSFIIVSRLDFCGPKSVSGTIRTPCPSVSRLWSVTDNELIYVGAAALLFNGRHDARLPAFLMEKLSGDARIGSRTSRRISGLKYIDGSYHRRNNHRDRGRLVPLTFRLGTNNVLVPQLLDRSFQKARNFTASIHQNAGCSIWVFKKKFPGMIPQTLKAGGATPPAPNTQPGLLPGAGCKRPGVGTQTLVPLMVVTVCQDIS